MRRKPRLEQNCIIICCSLKPFGINCLIPSFNQAEGDPQFAFGTSSLALDAAQKWDASEKQRIADKEPEVESKFGQVRIGC